MSDYENFKRAAIRDQDVIVSCPFNFSHLINKSKFQYHLVKCAKQHILNDIETCPYNATHRVPKSEFVSHVTVCPDRRILETEKYQTKEEYEKKESNLREFSLPALPTSRENWDEEELQSSYNPQEYLENKKVLRNLCGATKSERKKFRDAERKRVSNLSKEADNPEPNHTNLAETFPLRPPKSLPKALTVHEQDSRLGMGRGRNLKSHVVEDCANATVSGTMGRGRGAIPRK